MLGHRTDLGGTGARVACATTCRSVEAQDRNEGGRGGAPLPLAETAGEPEGRVGRSGGWRWVAVQREGERHEGCQGRETKG